MNEMENKSVAEIVDLARAPLKTLTVVDGGVPFAVIPSTCKVEDLTKYLYNDKNATPQRKNGTAKVRDAASFIEYVTLFRDQESRIFADDTAGCFLAVLDYHESGAGNPRWGQHRADFTLRKSREWMLWVGKNGESKKMSQLEFGQFIEDNAPDIVEPSSATMLEIARDMRATSGMDFASQQQINSGSMVLKFTEQVKGTFGKEQAEIPESFKISVPVYFGGALEPVTARLRYRPSNGKVVFWYDLLRADVIEQQGFETIAEHLADKLSMTIINGTP